MSRYWWVNHKQTFRQEIEGQYLWSPKTNSNGARNEFYNNMRRADPGDIVISYADQTIKYIGRVADFAFTAPKPEEFGTTGEYWNQEGWLLPVFWIPLTPAVYLKTQFPLLKKFLPSRYSPINLSTGGGNQGAYLAEIERAVFDIVVASSGYDHIALARGGQNSLTFQVVSELLDDAVERQIERDPSLDKTIKETVILARRGQGQFRRNVEAIEPRCRLTGITNPTLLIAGHIKPWRSCNSAQERLDGNNGLMLTPDADLLFDRGFISFDDKGKILVSPRVDDADLRRLGFEQLTASVRSGTADSWANWVGAGSLVRQQDYLAYHRQAIFVS